MYEQRGLRTSVLELSENVDGENGNEIFRGVELHVNDLVLCYESEKNLKGSIWEVFCR